MSPTIFKRLYWAGFHGRFAPVRWESIRMLDLAGYNLSDLYAYKAASSLKTYLNQLQDRFPDYRLHLFAHSGGAAIASEALSEGAPFDTLILSQVSMPASCYDVNAPTNADLVARDTPPLSTPEWQPMGYRGAHTNMAGRVVNFFATNDYNLDLWLTYQKVFKPSGNYSYDGTNCWYRFDPEHNLYRLVTDAQESRAMISRSRTLGIGAQGPSNGQTGQGIIESAVDVQSRFGFGATLKEHSAFFIRPIQTIRPYYQQVLTSCQIQPAP